MFPEQPSHVKYISDSYVRLGNKQCHGVSLFTLQNKKRKEKKKLFDGFLALATVD